LPIKQDDFGCWYELFEQIVDEHFNGEKAGYAKEMASKIASSFSVRMAMNGKFNDQEEE
jgi:hemoglobin